MELKFLIGILLSTIATSKAILDPAGIKCHDTKCSVSEYCSVYDYQCKPCSFVCNSSTHNYDEKVCVEHCQEYLRDQRYVLRSDLNQQTDLTDKVRNLTTFVYTSFSLTFLLLLIVIYFNVKPFFKLKKIRETIVKIFRRRWIKKKKNVNKVSDNGESGTTKPQQNPIQLTMPTITATIVSSTQDANGTQNTSSTTIDTTLDFAYDNPAMTSSPESTAIKAKRESSF